MINTINLNIAYVKTDKFNYKLSKKIIDMLHFDELIEKLADWFMDFFLDPVYVVETTSGRIEVVSMNNQMFEPVMAINDKDMTIFSDVGYTVTSLAENLSAIVTSGIKKTALLTRAVAHCYNNISTRVTLFDNVSDYRNFCVVYPKWLTG